MGSSIGEKRNFENGDISYPKCKRRKVSAVRIFPNGCGPTGPSKYKQNKANGVQGVNKPKADVVLGEVVKDIESCKRKAENKELKIPSIENPYIFEEIQTLEEKPILRDEKHDSSNNFVQGCLECPTFWKDSSAADPKELANVAIDKMDEGTTEEQNLLSYYPIPSNLVWKERKYPTPRIVSAVYDFPAGRGRNLTSHSEKYQVIEGENKGSLEVGKNDEDTIQGIASGKSGDTHEKPSKFDGIAEKGVIVLGLSCAPFLTSQCRDTLVVGDENKGSLEGGKSDEDTMQGIVSAKSRDTHEKLSKVGGTAEKGFIVLGLPCAVFLMSHCHKRQVGGGENKGPLEGGKNDEDTIQGIVWGKSRDKHEKPLKVDGMAGNVAVSEIEKGVIVLGLSCAAYCPFEQVKRPAQLSHSLVHEKEVNGKKRSYDAQDNQKLSLSKHEDSEMLSGTENDNFSRQLALRDDEDYFKDEEHEFESLPSTYDCDVTLAPFVACSSIEKGARTKVREALRLFQALVRKILQGEEPNSKESRNAGKNVHSQAANILKKEGKYINTKKIIGLVPGIEIGDTFSYRVELAIIGLHSPLQGDIDTIKLGNLYFATSVVASGGDDNDVDDRNVLIYTGQGGNQLLDRGNLALQNCIDNKNPVRVIRSFQETEPTNTGDWKPKTITTYTYDGLYTVERYWHQWITVGSHGDLVYRFELIRIPGQQPLTLKKCKTWDRVCVDDISNGKETIPIRAVNTIDDEKPPPFTYITSTIYPDWCRPLPLRGCECKTDCSGYNLCSCTIKNGGEIPYNLSGAIVEAKDIVYECGPSCDCPPSCPNRVGQHGIKLPLEIFKTDSMGWGVRCLSPIPSGSFICEYIGELLDDREAEQRVGSDEYLFDIGQNYNDLVSDVPEIARNVESIGFTIDAASYGNVGRFVNHSCSPNLYAQNVLYDHEDERIPHVMLFAAEDIPSLQELTYHYNYTIDQVFDLKGNIKKKNCYCGSSECTGRMY